MTALFVMGDDGEQNRAVLDADFSGDARSVFGLQGLLPPDATYRFEVEVADEGGTWRVRDARWEAVVNAPPVAPAS